MYKKWSFKEDLPFQKKERLENNELNIHHYKFRKGIVIFKTREEGNSKVNSINQHNKKHSIKESTKPKTVVLERLVKKLLSRLKIIRTGNGAEIHIQQRFKRKVILNTFYQFKNQIKQIILQISVLKENILKNPIIILFKKCIYLKILSQENTARFYKSFFQNFMYKIIPSLLKSSREWRAYVPTHSLKPV